MSAQRAREPRQPVRIGNNVAGAALAALLGAAARDALATPFGKVSRVLAAGAAR